MRVLEYPCRGLLDFIFKVRLNSEYSSVPHHRQLLSCLVNPFDDDCVEEGFQNERMVIG